MGLIQKAIGGGGEGEWNPDKTLQNAVLDPTENLTGAANASGSSISNAWKTSVNDPLAKLGDKATQAWDQVSSLFNPTANQGILANQAGINGPGTTPVQVTAPAMGGGTGPGSVGSMQAPTAVALGAQDPKFKAAQLAAISQLQGQAAGTGPSVAANQLKAAQEANLAATIAQANTARGAAGPAMARAAMQTNAEMQGRAAQEAATARLQEQMQAAGMLGQIAGQGREQELAGVTAAADVGLQNQQLAQQFQGVQGQLAAQYAQMGLDAQQANQAADLKLKELIQNGAISQQQLQMAALTGDRDFLGNMLNAGGGAIGGLATLFSDENLKTNIEDAEPALRTFLDNLSAYEYDYKDKKHGAGRYVSPMAQDLLKSDIGRSMVIEKEEGLAVDYGRGFGALLAAQASLNKRLAKIEKKRA